MVRALTEQEAVLLRTVAFWLREEMLSSLKEVSPSPSLLWDIAQSEFEISCDALSRVNMLKPEGSYWRVMKPEKDQLFFSGKYTRSDLDHLLDGLACYSGHVGDLYRHYETITPTKPVLHEVCKAMADCGYMDVTSPTTFEWNDTFGPWLVRHNEWDLEEFATASQEELDAVLAAIPSTAKDWLSGCSHKPDFVRCFFAQWINGRWEEDEWRYAPNDDWDLHLAAGLYTYLHSK